jgi:hypothetical protein
MTDDAWARYSSRAHIIIMIDSSCCEEAYLRHLHPKDIAMKLRASLLAVATVLALSGPVAVWAPPAQAQMSGEIVIGNAPPPPRVEVVPGPRPGWVWDPGHWVWNGRAHVWAAGHWIHERRGWRRIPAQWEQTPRGWHFVPAHWAH